MKTRPHGCRQDPVPWWYDELDEAIYERIRLKKIRDLPVSDTPVEERQRQYRAQAAIVQQLIQRRGHVTEVRNRSLEVHSRTEANSGHDQALAREPRDCPDQISRDKAGRMYAKDGEKAAAYLRLFSQVCKRELKPLVLTKTGARAYRYRSSRQAQAATVRRLRQKEVVRASLREHANRAPFVSMFELRTALAMIHTGFPMR